MASAVAPADDAGLPIFRAPRRLDLPSVWHIPEDPLVIIPERPDVEWDHGAMLIPALLSRDECKGWIRETERMGFGSLASRYNVEYRGNTRCTVTHAAWADKLWERLQPLMGVEPNRVGGAWQ